MVTIIKESLKFLPFKNGTVSEQRERTNPESGLEETEFKIALDTIDAGRDNNFNISHVWLFSGDFVAS